MQGIQPGGDRHINALIIGLKRALDLMPLEPMPRTPEPIRTSQSADPGETHNDDIRHTGFLPA
jgi:hypothetical protein